MFLAPFKWTPSGQGILSELVYGWIGSQNVLSHILALVLLLIQGFLVNLLAISNRLSNEVNLFPGLFFILLSCALPDFLYLSPVLIGNTFFLIAMVELFKTYKNPACADSIFNVGLSIGIAGMFYFPFLFFFILGIAGLNILRAFTIREQLMILLGILVPVFLTGLYFYWFDRLDFFLESQFSRNFGFFNFQFIAGWEGYLKAGIFLLLIIFAVFNSGGYLVKKNIQVQKKIGILFWVLITGAFAAIFQSEITLEHFLMLAMPLGIFLGLTFTSMKPQWAEALHFLMVVSVLAFQFATWLL